MELNFAFLACEIWVHSSHNSLFRANLMVYQKRKYFFTMVFPDVLGIIGDGEQGEKN